MEPELASKASRPWWTLADALGPIGDRAAALAWNPEQPQIRHELSAMLLATLMRGYTQYIYADPDYPEIMPTLGLPLNVAAPVPDFLYKGSPIRGNGVYRLSGNRGTCRFVDFFAIEITPTGNSGALTTYRLDELNLSPTGDFEVIVSNERPGGYAGDWWRLDSRATQLMARCAAYDWLSEVDPTFQIERVDVPARKPRRDVASAEQRLADLITFTNDYAQRWLKHENAQKAKGLVNTLEIHDYGAVGGAQGQVYLEGIYDLAPDEALLIDTEVPAECRYWSFLVSDELFVTLNWMHRFSSINGHQAQLSADGRFRAVISAQDPGAPNWLDVGDYRTGFVQGRWNNASSAPIPVVTRIKVSNVWAHLPADTPRVSVEERDRLLRLRRKGAQRRRFW